MRLRSRRAVAGLAGAAVMIAAVTVVSRLLGFARTMVSLGTVGGTAVGDAYAKANMLPNVLFEVAAGGALAGALIPVLAGPLARGMRADVDRIASALLGWVLAVLTTLAVALALLAGPVARVLVHVDGTQRDLVQRVVVVFAVQIPLYGVGVVLSGVLQAQRKFFWPAFAPILSSMVVIGAYVMFGRGVRGVDLGGGPGSQLPDIALNWLAWGTTAGVAVMSVPLLMPVWRSGVRLRPTLRFPPGTAHRARALALAGIGALVAQQLAIVVTALIADRTGTSGSYAVFLQAVQAVYVLPYAVLAVPLATSTFPRLAERAAVGDHAGYARMASATTRAVLVASTVGAGALIAVVPAVVGVFAVIGKGDRPGTARHGPDLPCVTLAVRTRARACGRGRDEPRLVHGGRRVRRRVPCPRAVRAGWPGNPDRPVDRQHRRHGRGRRRAARRTAAGSRGRCDGRTDSNAHRPGRLGRVRRRRRALDGRQRAGVRG